MKRFLTLLLAASIACTVFAAAPHDDVIPHRQDEPPNEPFSPQEALERMTVPSGFNVELVASEPDLVNPVAMTFDDRGRIWVTESVEYPRKPAGSGRDRVKILEDTDADGRADKVTVFADGLNIPTGVAVGYGGVWVVNAPDLLFLREKDGIETSRQVVVTGFGRTDTHELPNSLGTRRLAVWPQRRVQPVQRSIEQRQTIRIQLCAVARSPAHARIPDRR
jgi:glucose/arabinose dehydrogenase